MKAKALVRVLLLLAAAVALPANAQDACGDLSNHFGPYDYRTSNKARRDIVEAYHFTSEVEALRAGKSGSNIAADITYTLRAFPNHPRALNAMANLARRQKTQKPNGSAYTVDCWFERAQRFAPDDGNVYGVHGVQLLKDNKAKEALAQFAKSEQHNGSSGNLYYNIGLAHFEMKDYARAKEYAKKAQSMGYDLPGLPAKLKSVGQWEGDVPRAARKAAPAAPAAAAAPAGESATGQTGAAAPPEASTQSAAPAPSPSPSP